jgi:hypothetical protein
MIVVCLKSDVIKQHDIATIIANIVVADPEVS